MKFYKNKLFILYFCLLIALNITGCSFLENKPETIYAENSNGYYFDVYSSTSKDTSRNGQIHLKSIDDKLFFEIANSSQERQFAVQVFLDYQQVPFVIDEKEYSTFFVDFDSEETGIYEFAISKDINKDYKHSLLVILTAGSDIITKDIDFDMTDMYSIALNHVLLYKEDALPIPIDKVYENTMISSTQSSGLLLNSDIEGYSRRIPDKELHVNKNQPFELQYQVGGYTNCDEIIIILTIGFEQSKMNEKSYLLFNTAGELVQGTLLLTAPKEAGNYEVMAWAVKNPFDIEKNEFLPLDSSIRFTLVVE